MVILSNELQPLNAPLPILVTLSGMTTDFKSAQNAKAELPILVTLFPMVTEFKLLHP